MVRATSQPSSKNEPCECYHFNDATPHSFSCSINPHTCDIFFQCVEPHTTTERFIHFYHFAYCLADGGVGQGYIVWVVQNICWRITTMRVNGRWFPIGLCGWVMCERMEQTRAVLGLPDYLSLRFLVYSMSNKSEFRVVSLNMMRHCNVRCSRWCWNQDRHHLSNMRMC